MSSKFAPVIQRLFDKAIAYKNTWEGGMANDRDDAKGEGRAATL